jgi:hypothetical protein
MRSRWRMSRFARSRHTPSSGPSSTVRVRALVELDDHEAIDVFVRKEDALKALEDACIDEPQWEGTLFVAPIRLEESEPSAN